MSYNSTEKELIIYEIFFSYPGKYLDRLLHEIQGNIKLTYASLWYKHIYVQSRAQISKYYVNTTVKGHPKILMYSE